MSNTLLVLFAALWPPLVMFLVLRFVPNLAGKFLEKEIERRSDAKLARVRSELEGTYATLQKSVDVLTAGASGLHPHIVESVSTLWTTIVALKSRLTGLLEFDAILLPAEADAAFKDQNEERNARVLRYVRPYASAHHEAMAPDILSDDIDRHRLFTGERLWLIFFITRAVLMRGAVLMAWSFERRQYQDWRKDSGMSQLFTTILAKEVVAEAAGATTAGLSTLLSRLEAEFLHEATRVMSGSKAVADSLAGIQSTMLLEHAKLAAQKRS